MPRPYGRNKLRMSKEQGACWCEGNAGRGWGWVGCVPEPGSSQITGRLWKPVLFYMHWDFKQENKLIYVLKDHSCCSHTIINTYLYICPSHWTTSSLAKGSRFSTFCLQSLVQCLAQDTAIQVLVEWTNEWVTNSLRVREQDEKVSPWAILLLAVILSDSVLFYGLSSGLYIIHESSLWSFRPTTGKAPECITLGSKQAEEC